MELKRTNYSSGAPLEEKVGYSRMVKAGPFVFVGGTTSVQPDGTVYGENAYEQTKYVLQKQVKLLEQAGASAAEVVKVKVYATDMQFSGEICRAYSELFHDIRPLCTVVGTPALNRPTQFVEIEMDAVIGCSL
jgi:enamine deaminase RidA (YjgF/YER057c/UK114 family)